MISRRNLRKVRTAAYPMFAPEGGKEALQAEMAEFSLGSDHQVYTDSSFGIPAIYLNDWPDRYIHTNFDTPANVDPTKLKRAAFIGAASAYFLANLKSEQTRLQSCACFNHTACDALQRCSSVAPRLPAEEAANLTRFHLSQERALVDSMERFFPHSGDARARTQRSFLPTWKSLSERLSLQRRRRVTARLVFRRNPTSERNDVCVWL